MNWALLKNSLMVGGISTAISLSLGVIASLWITGLERPARIAVLGFAVVALCMPPFLATNCWLHFLGATGVWRAWLPFNIFSLGGAIWILVLLTWPITLFLVCSAWSRLEVYQLESDPAVGGWPLFRGLLMPLARTALAQAAILTFVLALNNFAVPTILQVKVFTEEIWVRFNTAFDTRGALVLSWPLLLAPLIILWWFQKREIRWPRLVACVPPKLFRQQLGPASFWLCGAATICLCVLSVGLPLAQIIGARRTWVELPGAVAAGKWAVWSSLFYAGSGATLVITIALVLRGTSSKKAFSSSRFNPFNLFNLLLWFPFLVPGVLLGICLIAVFNRPWFSAFYQSAGIVILAFVIRYFALGWHTIAHAIAGQDRNLEDVARLNGATPWQLLRYVHWPQIRPMAGAAWYVVFLLCLWDVESMILVTPPGGETLALRIFNLLHYGHNAQVNALCFALLALALAPLLLWSLWLAAKSGTGHIIRLAALLFASVLLLTSCSPSPRSNEVAIESKLFSRVQIIGSRGVGVGELNKPRSLAVDRQDDLFVVDMTGRVQEFSPGGLFMRFWQLPQTDKGKPKGMCRDQAGNIVVVEPHYQRVNHFSTDGKLLSQWGQYGTNAGQFTLPRAVAVNSRGEAFVSEYGLVERVEKFRLQGSQTGAPASSAARFVATFGMMGNGPAEFNRPEGLCVDAQDRLYVADSCNHRIQVFSSDGKFIRTYGKAGTGKGELGYPYDICVDRAGRQYVCEFGNSRIQVFDEHDQPIEIIGGPGAEPGRFSNPWGVALDSVGNLYVADSLNHRVQKFVRRIGVASGDHAVFRVEYSELRSEQRIANTKPF